MIGEPMIRHLTCICISALLALSILAAGPAPMSDEDVVRLFVSGTGVDQILGRIAESETAFDLSDDMLYELRAAGLPAALIEAMIARQAEIDEANASDEPPDTVDVPAAGSALRIRINPSADGEERKPLRLLDLIDDETHDQLRLRTAEPAFTDMAIFVACRTQDHVPNQWRGKSPLGRDYISVQRHRMLYFHSGAELAERRRSNARLLELDLPAEIAIDLEPDVAHDLTLGVALRTEERYYLIAFDELDGLVLQEGGRVMDAQVSCGRDQLRSSLLVRFGD
jgi:hypothetical protein